MIKKIIFQLQALLLTLDASHCLSVPQHGPFSVLFNQELFEQEQLLERVVFSSGTSSLRVFLLLNVPSFPWVCPTGLFILYTAQ